MLLKSFEQGQLPVFFGFLFLIYCFRTLFLFQDIEWVSLLLLEVKNIQISEDKIVVITVVTFLLCSLFTIL